MKSKPTFTLGEACRILGLNGQKRCSRADVDAAYVRQMKHWTTIINGAISRSERERASDVIVLLREAKALCMQEFKTRRFINIPPSPPARPASKAAWQTARQPPPLQPGRAARVLRQPHRWRAVWRVIKGVLYAVFCFCRAVPAAVRLTIQLLADTIRQLEAAGIPKIVPLLALLLGFIGLIHGCGPKPK